MREATRTVGKDCLLLALTGVVTMLFYGFMSVDFGGRVLTSREAWDFGVVQPYMVSGVVLVALSLLIFLGVRWARWLVLFWLPVTFGCAIPWSIYRGVGNVDMLEFIFVGLPVVAIWLWGIWRIFFQRPAVSER